VSVEPPHRRQPGPVQLDDEALDLRPVGPDACGVGGVELGQVEARAEGPGLLGRDLPASRAIARQPCDVPAAESKAVYTPCGGRAISWSPHYEVAVVVPHGMQAGFGRGQPVWPAGVQHDSPRGPPPTGSLRAPPEPSGTPARFNTRKGKAQSKRRKFRIKAQGCLSLQPRSARLRSRLAS
jgi:hypothetical protein